MPSEVDVGHHQARRQDNGVCNYWDTVTPKVAELDANSATFRDQARSLPLS